jgi:hypothetical protein
MSNYSLIKEAILKKQQVIATYQNLERYMCPHIIGKDNEGCEKAFFWQFGGLSKSGGTVTPSTGVWRCLFLNELSGVSVCEGHWHTGPQDGHSSSQNCIFDKDVEVIY